MNRAIMLGRLAESPDVYATEDGGCITYLTILAENETNGSSRQTLPAVKVRIEGNEAEIGYEAKEGDIVYLEGSVRKFQKDGAGADFVWVGVAASKAILIERQSGSKEPVV